MIKNSKGSIAFKNLDDVFVDKNVVEKIYNFIESDVDCPPKSCYGVTRVLSNTKDDSGLIAWRNRVGDEEADRIIKESVDIGNSLDSMIFDYFEKGDLFNEEDYRTELGYNLFRQLKKELNKIKAISLQTKIWNLEYGILGYVDCIGYYNGVLSIIDFKNSRRIKTQEHYRDYLLQCTLYAIIFKLLLDIEVRQVVLLMGIRNEILPQIITERTSDYVREAMRRVKEFNFSKNTNSDIGSIGIK